MKQIKLGFKDFILLFMLQQLWILKIGGKMIIIFKVAR